MSDPRIDRNFRGVKCKGCGERYPFLLTDLCGHCVNERAKNEIERLQARVDALEAALDKIAMWGCINPEDHAATSEVAYKTLVALAATEQEGKE